MIETTNRIPDAETQLLVEMLTTVKAMDKPLQEKWLDYGTGLVEGFKLAKRQFHDEDKKCNM